MRAKTLNLSSSVFTTLYIGSDRALVRLEHREGEGFDISEAYLYVEKQLPTGNLGENFSEYKEIIDEWYNTEISASNGFSFYDDIDPKASITATGWAPMIGNYRYRYEFNLVCEQVEKMETHREHRTKVIQKKNAA